MLQEVIQKFSDLSKLYPKTIKLYNGASEQSLQLLKEIFPSLLETMGHLYKISDGFSLGDFCFLGIKNKKLVQLKDCNENLWGNSQGLMGKFVVFMATSTGDYFGLVNTRNHRNCIGYFNIDSTDKVKIICSSVEVYFSSLLDEVNSQLTNNAFIVGMPENSWPLDLNYWFARDAELRNMYVNDEIEII